VARGGPSRGRWRDGPGGESQLGHGKEKRWVGLSCCWVSCFGFFFLFPILLLSNSNSISNSRQMNSNLNLNSHKHSTNKTMLQHDATIKNKPMINFSFWRIKIRLNESLNTINLRILNKAN
jgi:hypothetical protein